MQVLSKHLILAAALLPSCDPPPRQPPPPPVVVVGQPVVRDVRGVFEAVGTTAAAARVEIRARVSGFLRSAEFEPGSEVEAGQLLFTIEPDRFESEVASARASLAIAAAEAKRAEADLARVEQALQTKAVSEMEVGLRRADRDKAAASVQAAEAGLNAAELELGYTRITSPIAGRVSRSLVSVGNLVGPGGQTSLLTTVLATQPMSVYFEVPERLVVQRLREVARAGESAAARVTIRMQLEGETGFPHEGYIDYAEGEVDPTTGTMQVRGRFENQDRRIVPGLFARIQVLDAAATSAVLVEEGAIGADLGGKYVLVLGEENLVERRYLELGAVDQGQRVVLSGLDAETTYIVEGTVKARPGLPVTPLTREQAAEARKSAARPAQGR
jgi:RND family efflux transporter MFP subunit